MALIEFEDGTQVEIDNPTPGNIMAVKKSIGTLGTRSTSYNQQPQKSILQQIPRPPVLPSELNKQTALNIASPLTSPIGRQLQRSGEQIASEVGGILGKSTGYPRTSKFLSEIFSLTPENLAISVGSELSPVFLEKVLGRFPKSVANRFFGKNAPKDIAEGRLIKGQLSVGEEVFNDPKLSALRINDKRTIYNRATQGINDLGNRIRQEISNIFQKGKPEKPLTPFTQPIADPVIRTRDIANSIDSILNEVGQSWGIESPKYRQIINFKNDFLSGKPDFMNFIQANTLREQLGKTIGKRFGLETGELPEIVHAHKTMFAALRNSIGKLSSKLDNLLKEQHTLFEIRRSIIHEAAKGFGKVPETATGILTKPISENLALANSIQKGFNIPGLGIGGAISKPLSEEIRE